MDYVKRLSYIYYLNDWTVDKTIYIYIYIYI